MPSYEDYQTGDSRGADAFQKYQAYNESQNTNGSQKAASSSRQSNGGKSSTLGGRNYSENTANQAKAAEDATERAANNAMNRSRIAGGDAINLARQRDDNVFQNEQRGAYLKQNLSEQSANNDRNFKKSESAADRNKSTDEFTQNRYQLKANQAQERSNQEFATNAQNENNRQEREAGLQKQARDIAANAALQAANNANQANIAFGDQGTSLKRAQEAAKAQVTAALYGASPQYQGY